MIISTTFENLHNLSQLGNEALVCLGCGGDLSEWENGVRDDLIEKGIAPADFNWTQVLKVETTGGRVDLIMFFDLGHMNMGALAIWRIRFGDCSWLSDYVVNYAGQHGY